MARAFWITGIVCLFCALALSFLTSVSLPFLVGLDITRVHFDTRVDTSSAGITQIRFGVWSRCEFNTNGDRICTAATGHGYLTGVQSPVNHASVIIGTSWTRGLVVHPVATAVTFIAFLLAFSKHVTLTLAASLVSFVAALITLVAFAIDIALYAYVHHEMGKLEGVKPNTITGPGFWLTFITLILLLLAGFTVCFGRRRDRLSGATQASYPMNKGFFSKFSKKKGDS